MTSPVVSVVMSVFNDERFLPKAVESILDQSFPDFEFIIIDDGSTDSSGSILDSYQKEDSRVRVYHQENRGLVESLNRACGLARGEYVARMDADDIAIRERLMWQVDFMEKHREVSVVGGAVDVINLAGKSLGTVSYPAEDREIKAALLHGSALVHPTVVMRREVLLSVGGYRKVAVDAEDYDLWLRIADRFQLANLDAIVLKYRRHPWQLTVRKLGQMALSLLAVQVAAFSRRNGNADPLDAVSGITPAVLAGLGVSETTQQRVLARMYRACIQTMADAGEYSVALNMLGEVLHSCDCKHMENWVLGDLRLSAARAYWHQRRFASSILTLGHAVVTRPKMLGRPLKPLLRWLRLVPAQ